MTENQFIQAVLKPLYLKVREHEMVTAPNAEEEFKNHDFTKEDPYSFANNYLLLKMFIYQINIPEVALLRDYLLHIELIDFNYFEE